MKKIVRLILILLLVGGGITFFFISRTTNYKINKTLKKMTLEQKIGQMIISYYYSAECDDFLKKNIETYGLGGIIILKNNIVDSEQLTKFTEDIQKTAKVPMFISITQEGGKVQTLQSKGDITVSSIPTMEELGKKNDEKKTYETGKILAGDLKKYGINMNFAPVIDIDDTSSRSFGNDEKIVANLGISLAKGMKEKGIIPVYKHFPGLGSATSESPRKLPVLSKTKKELYEKDLIPFQKGIKEGADVIMVGHVSIPEIDKFNPASLSRKVIKDLLKKELKYDGLVVTDALNTGLFQDEYSKTEIVTKAINAGVDILLLPGASKLTIESVVAAIDKKEITEEQINASVRKILELKYKYNIAK